ncbi:unnamed protein product [Caenorhabditis auriculariae]|uniref:Uncharacterized protein n=1 Tax=Caenorhabditis auriculariae TaxID=2777116 RepID=A0A8S1HB29_9PELO|nr:unnamed protein product [Caenorhabditis auriculariae]
MFVLSWYICILGLNILIVLGFTGDTLLFLQSKLVLFALLTYSQPFYVLLWRSKDYRKAFLKLWFPNLVPVDRTLVVSGRQSKISTF